MILDVSTTVFASVGWAATSYMKVPYYPFSARNSFTLHIILLASQRHPPCRLAAECRKETGGQQNV